MNVTLIDRYLISRDELEKTAGLLPYSPISMDALTSRHRDLSSISYPRRELSDVLSNYNLAISNDDAALANCRSLTDPAASVVVTGQQAGLFSGPLYTIYKIATAVRLARDEQARAGHPVIPVFWNATEDHDLSEIAACHFPGRRIEADFPNDGLAGERLDASVLDSLIQSLTDEASDDFKPTLSSLLRRDSDDYGHYSSAVIARLFRGTGLVILEPRLLRPIARPFFESAVRNNKLLNTALQKGADRLPDIDISPAFTPGQGTGLFFINNKGIRRQILKQGDNFLVDSHPISEADLLDMISSSPNNFSTGAWLRPVLQTSLLPVLAYIAGPGEYRYHLQLPDVFEVFNTIMPPIRLRNHATLLGPAESGLMAKLNLQPADIFRGPGPFYSKPDLPESYDNLFNESEAALNSIADALKSELSSLGLDRSIEGFISKSAKDLEKLRARAGKELERQAGVGNQRVDRFFQAVFPTNAPQERHINVVYFLRVYGLRLIPELIEAFEPQELRHYLLRPDDL